MVCNSSILLCRDYQNYSSLVNMSKNFFVCLTGTPDRVSSRGVSFGVESEVLEAKPLLHYNGRYVLEG